MQSINGIPISMLAILCILGIGIFITFSLYKRLILPVVLLRDNGHTSSKYFQRIEIVVWGLYLITVIYLALVASLPVTAILLTIIIFAFYDFWRNYFTGITLKLGNRLQLDDSIMVNGHSGRIVEFGNRNIKIESTIGEEILIPYRLASSEIKINQKGAPKVLSKTLEIDLSSISNFHELKPRLEKAIYSNPWILISSPISIRIDERKATIKCYVINNDFYEKAKQLILGVLNV